MAWSAAAVSRFAAGSPAAAPVPARLGAAASLLSFAGARGRRFGPVAASLSTSATGTLPACPRRPSLPYTGVLLGGLQVWC